MFRKKLYYSVLISAVFFAFEPVFAAEIHVSTWDELKSAVENGIDGAGAGGTVYLDKNIVVPGGESSAISTAVPGIVIDGQGNTITGIDTEARTDNIFLNCTNLKKESFQKRDTFVFKGIEEKLELFTGFDSIKITYEFNAPYFAIWSNPNKGVYVCIEPWWGISNYVNETNYLEDRKAINKLKENEETSFSYKYIFTKED